ncbi:MAG: sigma-70 family RNA polymerase sigma factor [Planctomycetes bacterium]|nr:sigma-70 family RNA polymerase sigma factor [Planctomycetota bacterium]
MTRGDRLTDTALAELFQAHRQGLAGAVRGIAGAALDPAELLQEAFLRALAAVRRGAVPDDPVAWAFVLTMNVARDARRRLARQRRVASLDEVADMEDDQGVQNPARQLARDEAVAAARAAIERLGDGEKDVFLMRVSGELTFEAAARELGIPVGTAKTRMRAALARLRRALAEHAPLTDHGGAR